MQFVSGFEIVLGVVKQFWPVWIALLIVLVPSFMYKKRLGLYGQLFDSGVGIAGVVICFFWLFTAIFAGTDRAVRSARAVLDHEGRAARGDRAGLAEGLSCSAATSSPATCSAAWSTAARSC